MSTPDRPLVLLTGASGYVGGRLLGPLLASSRRVRCLARRPEFLAPRVPAGVEVAAGDVLDRGSLDAALAGVEAAYYLVHAMGAAEGFEERDRRGAAHFRDAAAAAGLARVVYLGGLGGEDAALSSHLRSRQEVGRILREGPVPVLELRASIVIGSGSLSFEMIRALVERLPVMVTPRWVSVEAQPIGIEDLLAYLVASLDAPLPASRVVEIGGADRVSYGDLMREYARQRGLRRAMVPVPVLTPRLSSLWLGLVTPLYARIGRKLIDGLRHPTVVRDDAARRLFDVAPAGMAAAMAAALRNEDRDFAETRWHDALSAGGTPPARFGGARARHRFVDLREARVAAPPARAFAPIAAIGGRAGWYAHDWLWRLRGALDLLAGGVGMRRGRPEGRDPRPGDALDFWRVEAFEPGRRLRLAAEMKLPGRAWLDLSVAPDGDGAVIRQAALFDPVGLGGRLYWYLVWPLHVLVFRGLIRALARRAAARAEPGARGRTHPPSRERPAGARRSGVGDRGR